MKNYNPVFYRAMGVDVSVVDGVMFAQAAKGRIIRPFDIQRGVEGPSLFSEFSKVFTETDACNFVKRYGFIFLSTYEHPDLGANVLRNEALAQMGYAEPCSKVVEEAERLRIVLSGLSWLRRPDESASRLSQEYRQAKQALADINEAVSPIRVIAAAATAVNIETDDPMADYKCVYYVDSLRTAIYFSAFMEFVDGIPLRRCANDACRAWFGTSNGAKMYCCMACQVASKSRRYRSTHRVV